MVFGKSWRFNRCGFLSLAHKLKIDENLKNNIVGKHHMNQKINIQQLIKRKQ